MTSAPILLILDDERYWLERHYQFFRKHNFTCVPTLFAEHAIHLGTKLKDINCAIIDHILYDPTQPKDEREGSVTDVWIFRLHPKMVGDIRVARTNASCPRTCSLSNMPRNSNCQTWQISRRQAAIQML